MSPCLSVLSQAGFILNGPHPTQWDIRRGVESDLSGWMGCRTSEWNAELVFGFTVLLADHVKYRATPPDSNTHLGIKFYFNLFWNSISSPLSPGTNKKSSWYEIVTLTQLKINKNIGEKWPRYSYIVCNPLPIMRGKSRPVKK